VFRSRCLVAMVAPFACDSISREVVRNRARQYRGCLWKALLPVMLNLWLNQDPQKAHQVQGWDKASVRYGRVDECSKWEQRLVALSSATMLVQNSNMLGWVSLSGVAEEVHWEVLVPQAAKQVLVGESWLQQLGLGRLVRQAQWVLQTMAQVFQ